MKQKQRGRPKLKTKTVQANVRITIPERKKLDQKVLEESSKANPRFKRRSDLVRYCIANTFPDLMRTNRNND